MPFSKTIKREFEVAFYKNTQPVWLRILKYIVLAGLIYWLWDTKWLWPVLIGLLSSSLAVHFWYRYKTHRWTKSYGGWKYDGG